MSNPYKDYFEAALRDDEWAGIDQDKARQRVKKVQEIASWNGCSEEEVIASMNEMGDQITKYITEHPHSPDIDFITGIKQKPVTNDGQQECPYNDLALVKNFFGEYKRKCKLSNKACDSKECKLRVFQEEWVSGLNQRS